jgi:hypothetical protein
MVKWTENINGEPYTSRGVRTVRGRVLGNPITAMWKGAGCLAYILTTNVQSNGQAISLHNIGRDRSEPARKEIEKEYGLVQAESRNQKQQQQLKPFPLEKLNYGRTETKRAITNIVNTIIRQYNFSSLPELNAVLKQYHVVADRGKEDTRMYKSNGLVYSAIDDKGNKLGVAIKASTIYNKPTLQNLEKQFRQNQQSRKLYREMLKERVDKALAGYPQFSRNDLQQLLQKENIKVVFRENEQGRVYGITYIDQFKKSVFNGSQQQKQQQAPPIPYSKTQQHGANVLDDLLQNSPENRLPAELQKKRKRKKKQQQQRS